MSVVLGLGLQLGCRWMPRALPRSCHEPATHHWVRLGVGVGGGDAAKIGVRVSSFGSTDCRIE